MSTLFSIYKMFRLFVLCVSFSIVCAFPPSKQHPKIIPLRKNNHRIINGEDAILGQFPWQAQLHIMGEGSTNWICGGTIISEKWILTAGHCVQGGISGLVFTGTIDLLYGDESSAVEFILHEGYDIETLRDDIGLIGLASPLKFDANTAPIALAEEPLGEGVEITVSGFGVNDNTNTLSNTLKYVQLISISNTACNQTYGVILDDMVCAVSDSTPVKSPCSGDSGGPVVTDAELDPVLVAVSSFVGQQGCDSGAPSGYTRVAYYRDWIREKTGI